jgi:lipid II:glycine glycyltransferase (peptidoglycan interpeptide bridge formation enzyme)
MEVKEINNQQLLDKFVGSQDKSQFLQSWSWGEFQHSQRNKVIRLGLYDGENIIGSAQVLEQILPLGKKYWYIPRGPVVDAKLPVEKFQVVWRTLLKEIVSRADKQRAMFVKIEPPLEKYNQQLFDGLVQNYDIKGVKFVQPSDSWYLELNKSESELLAFMHQKTRYNIRLAERKGVTVRTTGVVDDFEVFWQLMRETAKRDKFHSHGRAYYHDMYRQLVQTDFMKMFIAELKGKIIAANMVVFFGDTVTYVHGASSNQYRNIMAPHVLQWRQIQAAKKEGFKYYDFWGVAPEGQEKHQWAGITRFKKSFGGKGISYLGACDLILDKFWYTLYKVSHKLRFR